MERELGTTIYEALVIALKNGSHHWVLEIEFEMPN